MGALLLCMMATAQNRTVNPEAKQFRYSTTIEKERPELNEETKRCIAAYRRDPSDANYTALKRQVEANYYAEKYVDKPIMKYRFSFAADGTATSTGTDWK